MIHDIQDFNERMREPRVQRNVRRLRWTVSAAIAFVIVTEALRLMGY